MQRFFENWCGRCCCNDCYFIDGIGIKCYIVFVLVFVICGCCVVENFGILG